MSSNKIAAIFARVSTLRQGEKSLPDQIKEVKAMLEHRGFIVPQERILAVDWGSPVLLDCPQYQTLKGWIYNHEIAAVGDWNRDRSIAEGMGRLAFYKICKDNNVLWLSCIGGELPEGRTGELVAFLEGWAREGEVELKQDRARFGLRNRVINRHLPIRQHSVYGYIWDGLWRLIPNEDYPTLKLIFDLLRAGNTYRGIIRELKARGIPSPTGSPEWSKSTIMGIIRNPIYAGRYYALRRKAVEPQKRAAYTKKQYGKTSHQYVSLEDSIFLPEVVILDPPIMWEERSQILEQAKKRQTLSKRNGKRDYLLRGLIFCGTHTGKRGEPLRYVGCRYNNSYGYRCQVGGCAKPKLHGPTIEEWVKRLTKWMLKVHEEEGFLEALETITDEHSPKRTKDIINVELSSLETKHNKSVNAEAELEQKNLVGDIDPEVYQRLKLRFRAERKWVEERRNELLNQLHNLDRQAQAEDALEELYRKYWHRMDTLTTSEWRELLITLNLEVHIAPATSYVDCKPWFNYYKLSSTWRHVEQGKSHVYCWDIGPSDTVLELRYGVYLEDKDDARKIIDCVQPSLVGQTPLLPTPKLRAFLSFH